MSLAILSARDALFLELRRDGRTCREIAAVLGVNEAWAKGRAQALKRRGIAVPETPRSTVSRSRRADLDEAVIRLVGAGRTVAEIADALGTTQNAVRGRAHRLGDRCPPRERPPVEAPVRDSRPAHAPNAELAVLLTAFVPETDRILVGFGALEALACRWPFDGDDGSTAFCGARTENGTPYCACHRRVAFGPARRPPRAEAAGA